jgi:hypothetical protein
MHIFRNIQQVLGKDSEPARHFWTAMKNPRYAPTYVALLQRVLGYWRGQRDKQKSRFLKRLLAEWPQWAAVETAAFTEVQTSQRVEGLFGTYKTMLDHKVTTFLDAANTLRIVGEIAFEKSLNLKTKHISERIMSLNDQWSAGNYVIKWLAVALDGFDWNHPPDPRDCQCHHLYPGFPCRHVMSRKLAEGGGEPLLSIDDVPERWRRFPFLDPYGQIVPHHHRTTDRLSESGTDASFPSDEALTAFFARVVAQARDTPRSQRLINQFMTQWNTLKKEKTKTDREHMDENEDSMNQFERLYDPPPTAVSGRKFAHPADNSPLTTFGQKRKHTKRKMIRPKGKK